MVQSFRNAQVSPHVTPRGPVAGGHRSAGVRASLRGLSFDEQVAALAPQAEAKPTWKPGMKAPAPARPPRGVHRLGAPLAEVKRGYDTLPDLAETKRGYDTLPDLAETKRGYDTLPDLADTKRGYDTLPELAGARRGYDTLPELAGARRGSDVLPGMAAPEAAAPAAAPPEAAPQARPEPVAAPKPVAPPVAPPVADDRRRDMRRDAKHHNHGATRLPLSRSEKNAKGWALLPMTKECLMLDTQEATFNTVYHYATQKAAEGGRGKARTAHRADFLVRLEGGKFVRDSTDDALDTMKEVVPNYAINTAVADFMRKTIEKKKRAPTSDEKAKHVRKLHAAGGRFIYVMNASGQVFAGQNRATVQHHSSFLAGGAVAGAGDMVVAGGVLKHISNMSGHYLPGPAYLWQVCKQLEAHGVDLAGVSIEVMNVSGKFTSAAEFLTAIDPSKDTNLFDATLGIHACNKYLANKRAAKKPAAA